MLEYATYLIERRYPVPYNDAVELANYLMAQQKLENNK